MIIEGNSLARTKRALIAYLGYCALKSLQADEKQSKEYWDPEIEETDKLIKAVNINLQNSQDYAIPYSAPGGAPLKKVTVG